LLLSNLQANLETLLRFEHFNVSRNVSHLPTHALRQHNTLAPLAAQYCLTKATYSSTDTCDQSLSVGTVIQASSAMLPCCPARHTSPSAAYADKNWEVWTDETGARLADEYIQLDFEHKTTVRRIYTHGFAQKNQFTRSFHLSYSQNGAHWKYVTQMGKKKVSIIIVNKKSS
jgi:hypothetical protein